MSINEPRHNSGNEILDLLDMPLSIGDNILAITGMDRKVGIIKAFDDINNGKAMILTEDGDAFYSHNVLGINPLMAAKAEYFI